MRRLRKKQNQESDIDMTPMLDIVFILLIFFIVTTSFIKESGINLHRPDNKEGRPPTIDSPIVIRIIELENILFAGRLILQDSVQPNVEVALSKNPKAIIMIQVAETADTGLLVDVVDQVKRAGVVQVTVSNLAS